MSELIVDRDLCKRDGACVAVCQSRSITVDKDGFPEKHPDARCNLCGHCVSVCAFDALTHTELLKEAFLPISSEQPTPAMMDGFLMSRRSVREFKDQPIDRETMEALLEVARRAPTATNSQLLHWIVVSGKEKIRALAQEAMRGLNTSEVRPDLLEQWKNGYDFMLRGAPTVVVACTPTGYAWGKLDCAIALTFLELAAEARNLGVCWSGYVTRISGIHPPLNEALAVPEGYTVHGVLMLGERKFSYRWIPPRKPLSVQWT